MGERECVAVCAPQPRQRSIRASAYLPRIFASGKAVKPHVPAGIARSDVRRSQAFVVAVVPLAQVVAEDRLLSIPREPARLARPQQRTAEHK